MNDKQFIAEMRANPSDWGYPKYGIKNHRQHGWVKVYKDGYFIKSWYYESRQEKKDCVTMAYNYCRNRTNCYIETQNNPYNDVRTSAQYRK